MAARAETVERHRRALRRRAAVSEVPRPHAVAPSRTAPAKRLPDPLDQILDFGRQLVGAVSPQAIEALQDEIATKMRKIPTRLNSYGYDKWGFNPEVAARASLITAILYRYYFRVETHGIENIPPGRLLVIGNH